MTSEARWWDRLPDDLYRQGNDTHLDHSDPLKVRGTAGLDRILRSGLGAMIVAAAGPGLALPGGRARQRAALQEYAAIADRGDVEEIFPRPPRGIPITREAVGWSDYRPRNIPFRNLSFESPFQPLLPQLATAYQKSRKNRRAHAQYWYHEDGPRPTLIFLHGYLASQYAFNSWFFSLPWFYKHGYDILLANLPFHGARAEHWHPWNGYGYFSGGLAQTNEAMLQAVCDVRVWMDFLEARGAPKIGVSGLSLGGYITSLLAGVDERLAFAIPNSPVVAVFDMAMEWMPVRPFLRAMMWVDDIGIRELRHGMALHSPLSYPAKIASDRLLIISGAGDRFTAPRFVNLLHEHWRGSRLHWFPGNHIVHLRQGEYLRVMKRFMDRCCA